MMKKESLFDSLFQDVNRLTRKSAVDRALANLAQEQRILRILLGRENGISAQAALLYDDPQSGALILDELMPEVANTRLYPGEALLLWSTDTMPMGFPSEVLERVTWQRFAAVRILRPETFFQLQRRETLRAILGDSEKIIVQLQRFGARSLDGLCLDMSAGGLRIRMTAPHDYPLSAGELLAEVRFEFRGRSYQVSARVCHVTPAFAAKGSLQQVGLNFVDPPAMLQDHITQYAVRYDGDRLRRANG
ncbi:MAG: PilZ domain-containing protein [Acidithiobacillus sp.]